jgi:DNA-binding XRE family transcriptional regulator
MATSEFWKDLAAQFLALPDPLRELRADWYYEVGSGGIGSWTLTGIPNVFLRNQFEALARRGAMELMDERGAELLIAWLGALKKDGEGFRLDASGVSVDKTIGRNTQVMFGSINRICEASASFCKKQESRALQAEFEEKQQNDPRNWSPLRRQFEALEGIKNVITGPHETITEGFVRDILAKQYGVEPEEVTEEQIQFEVTGLLRDYPAITLIPLGAGPQLVPSQVEPQQTTKETVGAQINRLREECRLTVEEIAEKIGVEPRSVQRHEADTSIPYARHLRAYEREFSKILNRKIVINKMS